MSEIEKKHLPIPEQEEGAQKDIETKEETATTEEAMELFRSAKVRLLNINNWDKICGKASAVFKLTDENGQEVEEMPKAGYHFKIDIPAPGLKTGHGFDWVKVEAIEENKDGGKDSEYVVMRVRPCSNPLNASEDVAHFFSDKATSNFVVLREKNVVTAAVLGRNEIANTDAHDNFFDKLRNAVVGTGAIGGLSYPQWKSLANGLLGKH
jgi:hypothetical protein